MEIIKKIFSGRKIFCRSFFLQENFIFRGKNFLEIILKEDDRLAKDLYSRNFVKDLLMIEILKDTDSENPKTAKQIFDEIERLWRENENLKNISFYSEDEKSRLKSEKVSATITRHIHDMNKSGLYEILTCDEKKKGYYNKTGDKNFISDTTEPVSKKIEENFIFSSAEFAVIAMALYRTPSISTEETQQILNKFKDIISPEGAEFNDSLQKQIEYWGGIRRKPARKILPIIFEILKAISNRKQIKFRMYDRNFSSEQKYVEIERKIQKARKRGVRDKIYTVSPYFLVWDNDECYLIAAGNEDRILGCIYLQHFKISLMEDVKIIEDYRVPIIQTLEIVRYLFPSYSLYSRAFFDGELEEELLKVRSKMLFEFIKGTASETTHKYSLDRYMREHIYMESSELPPVAITIYFKEDFLDKFLTQFTLEQKFEIIYNRKENDEFKYQSRIIVQENDGLYRWLMQYSDQVKVIRPLKVREELKNRYESALKNLNL